MAAGDVKAHIAGRVWKIEVQVGEQVAEDDAILILESMKTEIPVVAPKAGKVAAIRVAEHDDVSEGQILAEIES